MSSNGFVQPTTFAEALSASVYEFAQAYVAAGLSIIPTRADGSKSPAWQALPSEWREEALCTKYTWKPYQQRLPTPSEIRQWFCDLPWGLQYGIAVVGGAVSGGLEIVDLDNLSVIEPWATYVERRAPGLLDKLVLVETPRPGLHVYFRSPVCGGSQKLARALIADPETGNLRPKTLIELKGEGGYVVAPGSPPQCHPTGRSYAYVGAVQLTQVPTLTADERTVLLDAARSLNTLEQTPPIVTPTPPRVSPAGNRPGDLFNAYATWAEILQPHGWVCVGVHHDGTEHWRRPGKATGQSATANFNGTKLLHVFSENADPFEGGKTYSKFAAFALLMHGNDFVAAARSLAASDYGQVVLPRQRRRRPQ